jgi:Fe-S oxidoreductase
MNPLPYVYAPGCALTAYKPELVEKILRALRQFLGDVPLYDTCCHADCELPDATTIINTCPGCNRRFKGKREGIATVSLWEVLAEYGGFPFPDYSGLTVAVHDACPTRGEPKLHEAVRTLLFRMNIRVAEPEFTMGSQRCCGDSACPDEPLPEIYARMKARADEMPAESVCVYCVSCAKAMYIGGKTPRYLPDLLFGERTDPTVYGENSVYRQLEPFRGKR